MDTPSSTSPLRRWLRRLTGRSGDTCQAEDVKCFRRDQAREQAFDSRDRGTRSVPLDKIVGSVGRYQDFDHEFRLKQRVPSERLERVKAAMREGTPLPPVKLYQIKDEYYVLDGNHRIAAAKERGQDDILATIVEFIPSADSLENIRYRERADFFDQTGLRVDIELTEVGQYERLLEQITDHHAYLNQAASTEGAGPVSLKVAAEDWYRTIYRPMTRIIRRGRLQDSFPRRTLADLYAYISWHQWRQVRRRAYGIGVDTLIPKDMEAFRSKMAETEKTGYPDMKQHVTAFVLMNVQAKKESRIIQKLFDLDAVTEIHSVFGEVDLLVKVELTRDLLSSDAEMISHFVHENVRQLPGVVSTRTLIPGFSKIK